MQLSNKSKLSLALTLSICLYGQAAFAVENTGGIYKQLYPGGPVYYIGSIDGVNITNTGGNVIINTDIDVSRSKSVYGGYSTDTSAASNNRVTFNNGKIFRLVGGESEYGPADNNTVTINGGTVSEVAGGSANDVSANNNTVNINGGMVSSRVHGGIARTYNGTVVNASGNTVNVNGGIVNAEVYGAISRNGDITGNTVNMMNGSVQQGICGGESSKGTASGNKVHISGGSFTGGFVIGGFGDEGNAINNTVEISGGDIAADTMIAAGGSSTIRVVDNSVIIKGGTLGDDIKIYAGYCYDPNSAAINNNTITIEGTPTIGANLELYGGYNFAGPVVDIRTGNTLNIYLSGLAAKTVDNFQHYDLALDKNNVTLTVTDALTLQAGDTIKSTRVLNELNIGDTVKLLKSDGGLDLSAATLVNGKAKQGALYIYGYELKQDANGVLVADILTKEGNKQTMSVADGQLAAMGMLRSGADLISGSAMTTAAQNVKQYDIFASMNYGNYHINSVSNIDVQGTSMLVGMSRNLQHTNSNTTVGAFLESGWGTYDSELGEARAKGHTNYYGLGVLARHNNNSGIYTEGSLRVGKVGNTYSGHQADDGMYDASSTYYGLHLGIGKINKINENTNIDYYGKYFYAHENGTDAKLLGDKFDFDSIDSHRIRIGARLNNTNKNITRYVGLAYEYEFSGTARASAYGMDIASPSAKGSSGLLELGVTYKPATDSRFSMDLGLTGYAGKRQGVGGNVNLNWAF